MNVRLDSPDILLSSVITSTRTRRIGLPIATALATFLMLASPGSSQSEAARSPGPELTLVATANPTIFRVQLHNPGDEALVLNVGMALANGRVQYVNAVHYTLTEPGGQTLDLELIGPAIISGRLDPLVVPLPPKATFSFLLNLENCSAPKEKVWKLQLRRGHYRLQAEYTGRAVSAPQASIDLKAIAQMPFWTGVVTSPVVTFTVGQNI